jgi:hypothetical protein
MSIGAVVLVIVVVEALLLSVALGWLLRGLGSAPSASSADGRMPTVRPLPRPESAPAAGSPAAAPRTITLSEHPVTAGV